MNVYQKLNQARVNLQESDIKKTGKNKHLGFEYFELADFLQVINKINNEIGICTAFKTFDTKSELHVFNAEKPEEVIVFESPVAHAKLQGNASAIQELGSQHTYMRRYLYLMAYEIIENDVQDARIGSQAQKQSQPTNTPQEAKPLSDGQIKRLYAIASNKGRNSEQVSAAVKSHYKVESLTQLTKKQYDEIVKKYEDMEDVKSE